MENHEGSSALTIALALASGVLAQAVARHLRVPGIVLLLGLGVLLGPDVLGLVNPDDLGSGLHVLVGFAIAVILFDGGLNLSWRAILRERLVIRRLVTVGALVTLAAGAALAHYVLLWPWSTAFVFGSLVVVTGPTVVTPLLRRFKVSRPLETVLEAEGILIDAIGAILAVVTVELVLARDQPAIALGVIGLPVRLIAGVVFGMIGGALIALLLRWRRVVPEGLENVVTLGLALATFQISNAIMSETGIAAVIIAGLVVGSMRTHAGRELREFKEQLTVMLIGLLFVLLVADVRLAGVMALGWRGALVVLGLVLFVRPLGVALSAWGSTLTLRERAFVAWVAPRGIVAAAVSSLFADRLADAGVPGSEELRALVFLVIGVTVAVQGATLGVVAKLLGVDRETGRGCAILGATPLARRLARVLAEQGEDVVLFDANADSCREAEEDGLQVIFGNALDETLLARAEVDARAVAIGALPNEGINLLFAEKARREFRVPRAYVAIQRGHGSMTPGMVRARGAEILFREPQDLELWSVRLRRGTAVEVRAVCDAPLSGVDPWTPPAELQQAMLPLVVKRSASVLPVTDATTVKAGDEVVWLVLDEREAEARAWLGAAGQRG